MAEYQLSVSFHSFGFVQVHAHNKSEALAEALKQADEGVVRWVASHEKVHFVEDNNPQVSPERSWQLVREHSYFRRAFCDLQEYISQLQAQRPNVLAEPDNADDHRSLTWLIHNVNKIKTQNLSRDYEPRYDEVAILCDMLRVLSEYIESTDKDHYLAQDSVGRENHIYKWVEKAYKQLEYLNNDIGEFLLLETTGGGEFTTFVKSVNGKNRVFTSRSEADNFAKDLVAPKVIRIR